MTTLYIWRTARLAAAARGAGGLNGRGDGVWRGIEFELVAGDLWAPGIATCDAKTSRLVNSRAGRAEDVRPVGTGRMGQRRARGAAPSYLQPFSIGCTGHRHRADSLSHHQNMCLPVFLLLPTLFLLCLTAPLSLHLPLSSSLRHCWPHLLLPLTLPSSLPLATTNISSGPSRQVLTSPWAPPPATPRHLTHGDTQLCWASTVALWRFLPREGEGVTDIMCGRRQAAFCVPLLCLGVATGRLDGIKWRRPALLHHLPTSAIHAFMRCHYCSLLDMGHLPLWWA